MRLFPVMGLLLAMWITPGTLPAQPAETAGLLTLQQYIQVLDNALSAAQKLKESPEKAEELQRNLASAWHVEANGRSFEISTDTIRRDLEAWQKKPDDALLEGIRQHLETLRYEAVRYEAPTANVSSRRALLSNILSRSEFRNVRGQTWMDQLKEKFTRLLVRLLGRALSSSAIPVVSNIVVYCLIAFAVLALAYWMYRSLRQSTRLETIMPTPLSVSAKAWPLWISEARAAADRGEWRHAVHFAYWGGISFLEAQGAWRPDIARTPREYLQLLSATSAHQPVLRVLTMRLESVWYGMQRADAEAFQQTLAELERLGCPCN